MYFNPKLYVDALGTEGEFVKIEGMKNPEGMSYWQPVRKWFFGIYINKYSGFHDYTGNFVEKEDVDNETNNN